MTIVKLGQHTLNMISAWIGAITTLAIFIVRQPAFIHHCAVPVALAMIAIAVILIITRLNPTKDATLALSGTLGAAFSALSYCLVQ